jgi:hypothetical protein
MIHHGYNRSDLIAFIGSDCIVFADYRQKSKRPCSPGGERRLKAVAQITYPEDSSATLPSRMEDHISSTCAKTFSLDAVLLPQSKSTATDTLEARVRHERSHLNTANPDNQLDECLARCSRQPCRGGAALVFQRGVHHTTSAPAAARTTQERLTALTAF